MDAPVWEPLLNWFCFESDFADDFPAYGRMSNILDAEERDKWKQSLDAEERIKWEAYLDEFITTEDHVENVKRLEARAKQARDSMYGNRGSKNRYSRNNSCPSTSLWKRVLSSWRCSRQRSVLGRLELATESTYLGYLNGRSF